MPLTAEKGGASRGAGEIPGLDFIFLFFCFINGLHGGCVACEVN